ncbi:MAG: peptidase [Pseudonocardiales bacterium]|nr:peptidase [Pseudonocardiales bacterium]
MARSSGRFALIRCVRNRYARAVAVVAAAGALTFGLTGPAAVAAPTIASPAGYGSPSGSTVPAPLLAQKLSWSECYPGDGYPTLLCAKVVVPLDWNHPYGRRISIEISRIKAANPAKRLGVLFTNPGGPGDEGLDLPLFIPETDPSIAAAYDLIGIDQRGVGESLPVLQCADPSILNALYSLDGRDTSRKNQAAIKALDQKYATECSRNPLTPYIQHAQTVQDFDLVRQLLHEDKINYLGFSAGTQLGTWYAAVFPQHVGRFVLDGNLDWTSPSYESFNRQAKGFQTNFNNFLEPWIAKYNSDYGLGRSAKAVDATYEHRRAVLAKHPLTLTDGTTLNGSGYDSGIAGSLYVTSQYPYIAEALATIEHYSTATADEKDLVTSFFSASFGVGYDPFYSILCQDDRSQTYPQVLADTYYFRTHFPLLGANWNVYPCPFFTLPVHGSPVVGSRLPRLLMLNNDNDPATPLKNAQIARSRTPNARLVTIRNQAGHTIYGYGDECADGYANNYLLKGVLPAHDVSCPGLALPTPNASATVSSSSGSARNAVTSRLARPRW